MSLDEMDDHELEQMGKMGIPTGFNTTKGKHVDGNLDGITSAYNRGKYRQYMNKVVPAHKRKGMTGAPPRAGGDEG